MVLKLVTFIFLLSISSFGYSENVANVALNACENNICIQKCCPFNQYVGARKKCASYNENLTFDDLKVFSKDKTYFGKNASDLFEFTPGKFLNTTFKVQSVDYSRINFRMYLTETGILSMELPNSYTRWIDVNIENYCVDYKIDINEPTPHFWTITNDLNDTPAVSSAYLKWGMVVSCFFLMLVMIVYLILPGARTLSEKILMAYVASMFFAFVFLASIQWDRHSIITCLGLTYSIYFTFLASFCWMNIMSYDIWWTMRGYAKARRIHRRGECFKFLMYCIYGFGLPLAMTIMLAVFNIKNIMKDYPWFITPMVPQKGCFLEGGVKLLYLYIPMLILILCNWLFFLMTTFNIWRLSRGTAVLDSAAAGTPAAHRKHKIRFMAYLKLSIVMGLNWVLEVVSFLSPKLSIWYITDLYNILIGLMIFLIFVCKPKILRKLRKLICRRQSDPGSVSTAFVKHSSVSNYNIQDKTLPIDDTPKGLYYVFNNYPNF